jgi:CO/xanthine dehydrogenase Mo-binding subunit
MHNFIGATSCSSAAWPRAKARRRGDEKGGAVSAMLDRRAVLRAAGALVVTFTIRPGFSRTPVGPAVKTVSPDEVEGFLAIASNGRVTAYSGKVDLGTGVLTALTQIVADELDVPMDHVTIIQGDTALTDSIANRQRRKVGLELCGCFPHLRFRHPHPRLDRSFVRGRPI